MGGVQKREWERSEDTEEVLRTSTERDEEHTRPGLWHQSNMIPLHCARRVTVQREDRVAVRCRAAVK